MEIGLANLRVYDSAVVENSLLKRNLAALLFSESGTRQHVTFAWSLVSIIVRCLPRINDLRFIPV